jgi:hypothetical protein
MDDEHQERAEHRETHHYQLLDRIAVNASDAATLFDLSDRTWRRMHSAGLIPCPVKLGDSPRWRIKELLAWSEAGCPSRAKWERHRRDRRRF